MSPPGHIRVKRQSDRAHLTAVGLQGFAVIPMTHGGGHECGRYLECAMWWRVPGMVLLFLCVASSIPFAVWTISKSRLPSWMKGIWKWPLGDNLSRTVARLQGWANLFIGAASLVLLLLLAALPPLLNREAGEVRLVGGAVLLLVVVLLLVGVVLYVGSMLQSYKRPT